MPKPYHSFKTSQKTEINSVHIHDEIYQHHTEETNKQYNRELTLTIDRSSCNYENEKGKLYQQADTDLLLKLNCEKTGASYIKKVSEKTRNVFYNDLYIEIVSVFKYNNVTKKYTSEAPGWGLKNEELSPDCLSMLFLDKKNKKYISIFISEYKKLKQSLFNEKFYNNLHNGKIEEWLNKFIELDQNKGQKSFIKSIKNQSNNNVKDIVFAKNKEYITVGFTFSMKYIESLVNVKKYEGKILDQNTNNITY